MSLLGIYVRLGNQVPLVCECVTENTFSDASLPGSYMLNRFLEQRQVLPVTEIE